MTLKNNPIPYFFLFLAILTTGCQTVTVEKPAVPLETIEIQRADNLIGNYIAGAIPPCNKNNEYIKAFKFTDSDELFKLCVEYSGEFPEAMRYANESDQMVLEIVALNDLKPEDADDNPPIFVTTTSLKGSQAKNEKLVKNRMKEVVSFFDEGRKKQNMRPIRPGAKFVCLNDIKPRFAILRIVGKDNLTRLVQNLIKVTTENQSGKLSCKLLH